MPLSKKEPWHGEHHGGVQTGQAGESVLFVSQFPLSVTFMPQFFA